MPDVSREIWDWLAWQWFMPNTLMAFSWANSSYLYLLFVIPLIFLLRRLNNWSLRQKLEVALPEASLKWDAFSLLRYIPYLLMALTLICLVLSLSRPQRSKIEIEQSSEGIDIVLVLDISESMLLEDFQPNRLEAAKTVAQKFIEGRIYDRIGLVLFSGDAYSLCPLTTDYQMLKRYVREISANMILQGGTAIGSALGVATNRLRSSNAKTKVVILISDGDNTAGSLDPLSAAQLAAYYGLKIYSIVVGTKQKVLSRNSRGEEQYVDNSINEEVLRKIAEIGEGEFFRASSNSALTEVFRKIDTYEKSKIIETRFRNTQDYYHIYLVWGLLFFLLWLLSKSSFLSNVLED